MGHTRNKISQRVGRTLPGTAMKGLNNRAPVQLNSSDLHPKTSGAGPQGAPASKAAGRDVGHSGTQGETLCYRAASYHTKILLLLSVSWRSWSVLKVFRHTESCEPNGQATITGHLHPYHAALNPQETPDVGFCQMLQAGLLKPGFADRFPFS